MLRWRHVHYELRRNMDSGSIALLVIGGFLLILAVRKLMAMRGIKHYTPAEVFEKMKRKEGVVLLDVRTDGERSKQHIPGSLHIPLHQIGQRMDELEQHKGMEVICYCAMGGRSLSSAATLQKRGFRVANMKGGITAWTQSGLS